MAISAGTSAKGNLVDLSQGTISREVFVNNSIYQQEQEQVFARSWLFVGHESQIPNPGDYFVSSMGEESVILCRDRQRPDTRLPQHLHAPRHESLPLRRGQHRRLHLPLPRLELRHRRPARRRPLLQGSLPRATRQVPVGPHRSPQLVNYKGTIWANWDASAPGLLDYLGDMKTYLDTALDSRDGSEGGSEVLLGIQKWFIPSNWKFAAENFSGDAYHNISHRSVDMVGIGPSGRNRRDTDERDSAYPHLHRRPRRPRRPLLLAGSRHPLFLQLPEPSHRRRILPPLLRGAQEAVSAKRPASSAPWAPSSPMLLSRPAAPLHRRLAPSRHHEDRSLALVPRRQGRTLTKSRKSSATTTCATPAPPA